MSARRSMMGIAHNSPSLSGTTVLVRRDETAEAVRVHPPVAVGDGLQGDAIHARQPRRGALRQARSSRLYPFGRCRLAVRSALR